MSKYILNRKEFLLEKYVNVGENTEITDNEQVTVIQGRFNPCAHIGHLNMIKNANKLMGIPTNIDVINEEDIDEMVDKAFKEAHPLYPVAKLMSKDELKKIYLKIKTN